CGIAEAIIAQMVSEGISDEKARSQVYMVDRWGLLQEGMPNLLDFQQRLVQKHSNTKEWENEGNGFSLLDVMRNAKPTVLIGVSGAPGLFSQEVIEEMHKHCKRPIVFPLSNPTSRVEATPNDIIRWTNGEALVATGSPFDPVVHEGRTYPIAQCNNSYIFPGIGLGVLAVNAKRVTDEMLMESSRALATCSPLAINGRGALLPPLEEIHLVSKKIAFAVAKKAIEQGVALEITDEALNDAIDQAFWQPVYRRYKRTAF
ncbi:oxaloacetate-decarboxylating malate dehydrogenase, partial [Vibrio parahaemolyticus]|nr:oxaloacetate-decarboxylating malate dehydrogenase [Vibrio parahaemolyticus]